MSKARDCVMIQRPEGNDEVILHYVTSLELISYGNYGFNLADQKES